MSPKKTVLLVVNPISGDLDKEAFVAGVKSRAKKENHDVVLYETTGKSDERKIKELYREHEPDRVIIAGGDGTIKMVADALEKEHPLLGILPAGSANGLSVDLELPDGLENNLEAAFSDDFIDLDMVLINGHKSLHLSDIGLNAELIRNYENSRIRGKIGYALQSVNTLADAQPPFNARIKSREKLIETEARMIVVANSNKYGTGVTINPVGKIDDGKCEIIIIKNLDLVIFGKIVTGNMPLDTGDIEILSVEEAEVTTDVPVHFQIDGEYIGEVTKLDIRVMPHQMRVALPRV